MRVEDKRNDLYKKYLNLATYMENLYRNSDLDIVDAQFNFAKDKLLLIAYSLGLSRLKITGKTLDELENRYERYRVEIEKMRI